MKKNRIGGVLRKLIGQREFFIVIIVILVYIIVGGAKPAFLSRGNQVALFTGIASYLIIGVGLTILMISGCFDMSIGSTLALSGALAGLTAQSGMPMIVCLLVGVSVGACCGAFNGYFVAYMGMPAFVVTLATMNMFRGILIAISKGLSITTFPSYYLAIGQSKILGFPTPIWLSACVVIFGIFLLKKLFFFRQSYYIGGNAAAAWLMGFNVNRTRFLLYVLVGALAGFAGIVTTARYGSVSSTTGGDISLSIITAVIVGGASMAGGAGSILGTLFGTILMNSITNIVNLSGANVYWQTFIEGITLFCALCMDTFTTKTKERSARKEAEHLLRHRQN